MRTAKEQAADSRRTRRNLCLCL